MKEEGQTQRRARVSGTDIEVEAYRYKRETCRSGDQGDTVRIDTDTAMNRQVTRLKRE
jgi:hypothetical protein